MTPATSFKGKRVALFGLGGSGIATAKALIAGGASLACHDDQAASREKAAASGLPLVDLNTADWSGFDALVLAPGVPLTHDKGEPAPHWTVGKAKAAGVAIIGDIEIFFQERALRAPDGPVVCITGTNGKSTTTALVAHLLRTAGRVVEMGGNIGVNVLDLAPPANDRVHVLEVSTFQIDLTPSLKPSVGVMINLTPDHLDRHGSMEHYAAIKERVVVSADHAVCGVDDAWSRAMADRRAASGRALTKVTAEGRLPNGVVARGPWLSRVEGGEEFDIASLMDIASLAGRHNAQNAAMAAAAVLALGVDEQTIQRGLRSYRSLPHRMEPLGRVGRVRIINDSKATNADSTRGALSGGEGIFWILGGKAKDGGIEDLRPAFPAVAKAYLIGQATELFAATFTPGVSSRRQGIPDWTGDRAFRSNAYARRCP